jgi:flagella basal body P-ring formation protein FlgA
VDGQPSLSDSAIQSPSPKVAAEVYEATARLYVDPGPEPSEQDVALAKLAAGRYAELAMSRSIAAAIGDDLDLEASPASVLERIRAEADEASLEVVIRARDEDPSGAQRLAISAGTTLRQWVRDELVTDDVTAVTEDIRQTESLIRTLERRLQTLLNKSPKGFKDRAEIISLTGQLSSLRRDIQFLRESSRASVRNLLEWLERPQLPTQPVMTAAPEHAAPDPEPEAVIPTRSVVAAARPIEQGTTIEREMLTLRNVPLDASSDMAITDIGTAVGRVPAIDILENQIVTPNMLEAQ